jgi:hypothetical protein
MAVAVVRPTNARASAEERVYEFVESFAEDVRSANLADRGAVEGLCERLARIARDDAADGYARSMLRGYRAWRDGAEGRDIWAKGLYVISKSMRSS